MATRERGARSLRRRKELFGVEKPWSVGRSGPGGPEKQQLTAVDGVEPVEQFFCDEPFASAVAGKVEDLGEAEEGVHGGMMGERFRLLSRRQRRVVLQGARSSALIGHISERFTGERTWMRGSCLRTVSR